MKTRFVLGILLWTSIVVGALRLFGDLNDPIGVAAPLVVGGVVGTGVLLAARGIGARVRRRRVRSRAPIESELPAGPRRVLLFEAGMALGGVISGEHGIGTTKRKYFLELEDPVKVDLMRHIKAAFDPHGILNPGRLYGGL